MSHHLRWSAVVCLSAAIWSAGPLVAAPANLLLNPDFGFHSFDNSRTGGAACFRAGAVPCWDQAAYGDAEVYRAARVPGWRPQRFAENVVVLHPGKRFAQVVLLAEAGLDHGDRVSLSVTGRQSKPGALAASVQLLRIDSAEGTWSPGDYGQDDKRTFPKHSRGELVRAPGATVRSGDSLGEFGLKVENVEIVGAFTESADKPTAQPNTVALAVEFQNTSDQDVWFWSPCLAKGTQAQADLPVLRPVPTYYRHLPRTMQKLWRGEPLHIIAMGSSIDRGSANPPMYLFDEDPASKTYKTPLAGRAFDGEKVGRPDLTDTTGWWQHYFMYTGRLRQALMRKFNLPPSRLLLNVMACDGSSISESHSGLLDYATLSLAPDPNVNGHRAGKPWSALYPELFARSEGPRPDLVIYGSGANEKVDGADEIAAFEGALRWFQHRWPDTEFVFCVWQNRESYTPNTGHLMELALRYQIPYLDAGRLMSMTTRYCNSYALVPRDGHPQAAAHDLWGRILERAFDAVDPIEAGQAQLHLPERVSPYTLGWEGDLTTYAAGHPRLYQGSAMVLDDTVCNLWASSKAEGVAVVVDGQASKNSRRLSMRSRDVRNSTFAVGRLSLGDRHIIEVGGEEAKFTAVDAKTAYGRQALPVTSPAWGLGVLKPAAFASKWGEPYGGQAVLVPAGQTITLSCPAGRQAVLSLAWLDSPDGGKLQAELGGATLATWPTNEPFALASGEKVFLENRRAVRLAAGPQQVTIRAVDGPVAVIGAYLYDQAAR